MVVTGHTDRFTENNSNEINLQCSQGKFMHANRTSQKEAHLSLIQIFCAVNTLQKTYNRQTVTVEKYQSLFWGCETTGKQGVSDFFLDCNA